MRGGSENGPIRCTQEAIENPDFRRGGLPTSIGLERFSGRARVSRRHADPDETRDPAAGYAAGHFPDAEDRGRSGAVLVDPETAAAIVTARFVSMWRAGCAGVVRRTVHIRCDTAFEAVMARAVGRSQ